MPSETTPAASSSTAATVPAVNTTASVAPAANPPEQIKVIDSTPKNGAVHQIEIPRSRVAEILALIDPTAPAGRIAHSFSGAVGPQQQLKFTITYEA